MAIKMVSAIDNVAKVMNNADMAASTCVDTVTADAYIEDAAASDRVEQIFTDLNKKAEEVATKDPEATSVKTKNMYTDKITLDEALSDFNFKDLSDESDEDEYLDYDMFDFVYGLVTDDWPRPKNPLGRRMRKFQHTDSDDYMKSNEPTGMSQVATDIEGNIVIYANDEDAFNDVREACDFYHITYGDVTPRKSNKSHWAFNMKIYVPNTIEGYPMMVEDFFAQYGLTLSDVIEDHKVGGGKSANWGSTYEKRAEKDRTDAKTYVNDKEVRDIFDKFVKKAGNSNDPLEGFIKKMFSEMSSKDLKFSKVALKREFMSKFEDDFGND